MAPSRGCPSFLFRFPRDERRAGLVSARRSHPAIGKSFHTAGMSEDRPLVLMPPDFYLFSLAFSLKVSCVCIYFKMHI